MQRPYAVVVLSVPHKPIAPRPSLTYFQPPETIKNFLEDSLKENFQKVHFRGYEKGKYENKATMLDSMTRSAKARGEDVKCAMFFDDWCVFS